MRKHMYKVSLAFLLGLLALALTLGGAPAAPVSAGSGIGGCNGKIEACTQPTATPISDGGCSYCTPRPLPNTEPYPTAIIQGY